MTEIKAKKVLFKNRDGEHLIPYTNELENRITNCLLEVPQRIKLELNDGVLTLKAGSIVTVPNGSNVFDKVIINKDLSIGDNNSDTNLLVYRTDGTLFRRRLSTQTSSGTTTPTNGTLIFYNTTENKIYDIREGVVQDYGLCSLPIAIYTCDDTDINTIEQIFNGFGYIGSTVWADKGIKFLSADGRNTDGTLKNLEFETQKLMVRTNPLGASLGWWRLDNYELIDMSTKQNYFEQEEEPVGATHTVWYKPSENITRIVRGTAGQWEKFNGFYVASSSADSNGNITLFNPKLPFRAADDQEVIKKTGDTMTGDLTINKTGYQTLFFESPELDYTSTEQTNINGGRILNVDKNGEYYGYFQSRVDGNGAYTTAISTRRAIGGTNKSSTILVGVDKAGNVYTSAPTPATGDNSTKIATTAFVNTVLPVGTIVSSGNSSTPTGYLLCNGSAVSRTTYAKLFSAIGTTYGAGDGSTTFNLPNYSNYNFVTSATVGIKGTGKALGMTDGKTNIGTRAYATTTAIYGYKSSYNANVGTNSSTAGGVIDGATLGVVQNTSTSGLTGTASTAKLNWYIKY